MAGSNPSSLQQSAPMIKRTAFVLLVTLAAACSTPTPPAPPPAPPAKAPEAPPPPPPPPPPAPVAPPESPMQAFERMRAGLTNTSVYFDFDQYAIRPDQTAAITDNAKLASTFS